MFGLKFYLGGHEIGGIAGSHEESVLCSQLFGKPEICDPEALRFAGRTGIQEVGWLQISVNHALLVQKVDCGRL